MRLPPYFPNLLSSLRIALAPAMLGAAYSNSSAGFTVLLAMAVVGDAIDGTIARYLGTESVVGQRLDRWGDGLTVVSGAIGLSFLWLEIVEREWPWMVVVAAGYGMIGLRRWIEPAGAGKPPGWGVKACGWAVPASLLPLLNDWTEIPFAVAAVLQAATGAWRLADARRRTSEPRAPA